MREIIATPEVRMVLGRAGESGVTTVRFDVVQEWQKEVGAGGTLQLLVRMDYQDTYPATVKLQGSSAVWVVTGAETAKSGDGQAQLSYLLNGKVAKSACYSYTVLPSLEETAGAAPPEQVNPWYTHIEQMANEAHTAAIGAKDSAKKSAAAAKADADRAQAAAEQLADKAQKTYVDQTFAPAIRETLVGATVSTDMVSPVEHELGCKVYSENMIPFPFQEQPDNWKGVSFSYDNGVVTANGTAEQNIYVNLLPSHFSANPGMFSISGCPSISGCAISVNHDHDEITRDTGSGASFSVRKKINSLLLYIKSGTTLNGAVFKPKLQMGAKATPYTPYISDLSKAKVNVCGKNLVPFPFREKPENWKGVTFQYENGVITANGIAEENVYLQLLPTNFRAGAGSYSMSGCPKIEGCLIQARYDGKLGKYDQGDGVSFEVQSELTGLLVQINAGTTVENAVFKPMLCMGTTPAPFEPYQSKVYTPTAGGTVSGAKTVSPSMSVITYTPEVTLEVTYNMDTKKYIDKRLSELNNAILSMGGNI